MKQKYLYILIMLLLCISSILALTKFKENRVENDTYNILYHDDTIPGFNYHITINSKLDIVVEKEFLCSTKECKKENTSLLKSQYQVKMSKKHKELLRTYLQKWFLEGSKEIELYVNQLTEEESIVIESMIQPKEELLDTIESLHKQLFEVHSARLNCPTVSLIVYDDFTYKYIDTYGIDGYPIQSKTGTYTYDVSKILEKLEAYEIPERNIGPFILTTNNHSYELYDNHIELQEFLESISIFLDSCLESPI